MALLLGVVERFLDSREKTGLLLHLAQELVCRSAGWDAIGRSLEVASLCRWARVLYTLVVPMKYSRGLPC
jgi:hypothetical protein